jgi:hypothetical protein
MATPAQIESGMTANTASLIPTQSFQEACKILERFVDSAAAAEFLSITPRRVLDMARAGSLPAHPLGTGKRRVWRFRLSELEHSMSRNEPTSPAIVERRTPRGRQFQNAENGQ